MLCDRMVAARAGASDALRLEVLQARALKALLGNAIGPGARINYDLLLAVFRLPRLADRRQLDRALYHCAGAQSAVARQALG
jgi:hypothetical protein